MEKELLKRYATIKDKMRQLQDEELFLKEQILSDLKKNKLAKVESNFGNFTICTRYNWEYTDKVTTLEEKIKLAKLKEQEKGIAKATETNYLLFKPNSND